MQLQRPKCRRKVQYLYVLSGRTEPVGVVRFLIMMDDSVYLASGLPIVSLKETWELVNDQRLQGTTSQAARAETAACLRRWQIKVPVNFARKQRVRVLADGRAKYDA